LFADDDCVIVRKAGLTKAQIRQLIEDFNFTECPNCDNIFEVQPGELDTNIKDEEGKKLS
jgi:hypothetical protein